jgi:hypothetical protein
MLNSWAQLDLVNHYREFLTCYVVKCRLTLKNIGMLWICPQNIPRAVNIWQTIWFHRCCRCGSSKNAKPINAEPLKGGKSHAPCSYLMNLRATGCRTDVFLTWALGSAGIILKARAFETLGEGFCIRATSCKGLLEHLRKVRVNSRGRLWKVWPKIDRSRSRVLRWCNI